MALTRDANSRSGHDAQDISLLINKERYVLYCCVSSYIYFLLSRLQRLRFNEDAEQAVDDRENMHGSGSEEEEAQFDSNHTTTTLAPAPAAKKKPKIIAHTCAKADCGSKVTSVCECGDYFCSSHLNQGTHDCEEISQGVCGYISCAAWKKKQKVQVFECTFCYSLFCASHQNQEAHKCDDLPQNVTQQKDLEAERVEKADAKAKREAEAAQEAAQEAAMARMYQCPFGNCEKDFEPGFVCPGCNEAFCESHRFDHECANNAPVPAGQTTIAKFFCPQSSSSSSSSSMKVSCHECRVATKLFSCDDCGQYCQKHVDQDQHSCKKLLGVKRQHQQHLVKTPAAKSLTKQLAMPAKTPLPGNATATSVTPAATGACLTTVTVSGKRHREGEGGICGSSAKKVVGVHRDYCFLHGYDIHMGSGCTDMLTLSRGYTKRMRLATAHCTLQTANGVTRYGNTNNLVPYCYHHGWGNHIGRKCHDMIANKEKYSDDMREALRPRAIALKNSTGASIDASLANEGLLTAHGLWWNKTGWKVDTVKAK